MAQSTGEERVDEDASEGNPLEAADGPPSLGAPVRNRKRAALYALPFFALGVGNAALILVWGIKPLWAFAQLPPILFTTVLTYLVFRTDFLDDR